MDPLADMLVAIKNAQAAKKNLVRLPYSQVKFDVASQLLEAGFLQSVEKRGRKTKKILEVGPKFINGRGAISGVKRISRPGRRVYRKKDKLYPVKQGYGIMILSTSKGIMTDRSARKAGSGGEVIAEVW